LSETNKKAETEVDPYKICLYCGENVESDDVCGYCGGSVHEECAEKHEFECEDNVGENL
jgi:rRNA maturation endonuclease Nob1